MYEGMGHAPAFQFYGADFLMGVESLTNQQIGVYLRLLVYQWEHGGVPQDGAKVSRIAHESRSKTQRIWIEIAHKFRLDPDGLLRNPRLEEVRRKQLEYRELQSRRGRRGGLARAEKRLAAATSRLQPDRSSPVSGLRSPSPRKKKKSAPRARLYALPFTGDHHAEPPAAPAVPGEPPTLEDLGRLRAVKATLESGAPVLHQGRRARRRSRVP